jgi:hypothetical protein
VVAAIFSIVVLVVVAEVSPTYIFVCCSRWKYLLHVLLICKNDTSLIIAGQTFIDIICLSGGIY